MKAKGPIEYRMSGVGNELDNILLIRIDTPELRYFVTEPHVVDAMSIILCTQGSIRFRLNFKEHTLERGKMLLAFPHSLVEPLSVSDDLMLCSLLYSIDYVSSISIPSNFDVWYKLYNMPCITPTDKEFGDLLGYFDFMIEKYNEPNMPQKSEVLKFLLVALRIEVRAVYAHLDDNEISLTRMEQITRDFFALLYSNYKNERNIAFYAEKLHLTPKYLTTIIREQTGYSMLVWIHQAVISSAKYLLKSGEQTIQQISYELHFSDSSLFCRFFKKHTGMTPGEFRKTD